MVYILKITDGILDMLWPLALIYLMVVLIFSLMADNLTETFQVSIDKALPRVFRMIANSNLDYWYPMINEAPESFILLIILGLVGLYYIVNNIYFGVIYELARVLDNVMHGKRLGFIS